MAFALYAAPLDFDRNGRDDNAAQRGVTLQVQSLSSPGPPVPAPVNIFPTPVVLVHGLWDTQLAWSNFTPLVGNPRYFSFALPVGRYHKQT